MPFNMHARVAPRWEIGVATPSAEPESCWGHADVLGKGGGIHPRLQPRASSGSEKELDQKGDSEFPHPWCTPVSAWGTIPSGQRSSESLAQIS